MCSPLAGDVRHKRQASFVNSEEQKHLHPHPAFSHLSGSFHPNSRPLWCFSDRDRLPTLLFPLGRRAKLPPLSPFVRDHPVDLPGKLPASRQAKARPDHAASIPATEGSVQSPEHLTEGLSPGADAALPMADHQGRRGRAAGDCFKGLRVARAIRI